MKEGERKEREVVGKEEREGRKGVKRESKKEVGEGAWKEDWEV